MSLRGSGADDRPGLGRAQRRGHERPDRREKDRRVEQRGWGGAGVAHPLRAEPHGERLCRGIARAREGEHLAPLPDGDLAHEVGGGAEPVDPEPATVAGGYERAVADEAGAQQGRGLGVAARAGRCASIRIRWRNPQLVDG
jgi:hypothetical protein